MAKTFLAVLAAIGLMVFLPLYSCAQEVGTTAAATDTKELPPVEQPLVREGDFAFALAQALKLGEPRSEAEAQEMLALVGIAPESGWISDYPVTPAVIGDIRSAVRRAANEGRLTLDMADADKAVVAVAEEFGLPAMAEATDTQEPETTAESSPATTYDETRLTEYYHDYGPPAITYYEPPYSYGYLYDYVYDPFYYSGFFFPGYYILQNFTIVVNVDKHGRKWRGKDWAAVGGAGREGRGRGASDGAQVVSNQIIDPATGQPRVVDPATREVVAPTAERSRREARRAEWTSGRSAGNPDRAGFRRARAEGRDVFRNAPSTQAVGATPSASGNESGMRSLQRELSRGASRGDRSRRERVGTEGAGRTGISTQSAGSSRGERARERTQQVPSSTRTEDSRPMSVRGWTYGTTSGDRSSGSARSSEHSRSFGRSGGTAPEIGTSGSGRREMNTDRGRGRSFEAAPGVGGGGDRSRGRDWSTNTGYAGRGRDSSPDSGGISSGRRFESSSPGFDRPMRQAAPSFAPSAPSRDFGTRSAPSRGGGSTGRSERAFSSPSPGGDRGGGGREWSGGGRGGGERDGGHGRGGGGRGGGGSCRGRNC